MAQGYTQPVSGLGFLGFCSAGQRCLQQGRLNCAQPGRPQQPPSSCGVAPPSDSGDAPSPGISSGTEPTTAEDPRAGTRRGLGESESNLGSPAGGTWSRVSSWPKRLLLCGGRKGVRPSVHRGQQAYLSVYKL